MDDIEESEDKSSSSEGAEEEDIEQGHEVEIAWRSPVPTQIDATYKVFNVAGKATRYRVDRVFR